VVGIIEIGQSLLVGAVGIHQPIVQPQRSGDLLKGPGPGVVRVSTAAGPDDFRSIGRVVGVLVSYVGVARQLRQLLGVQLYLKTLLTFSALNWLVEPTRGIRALGHSTVSGKGHL
jgi:hypothetical protein